MNKTKTMEIYFEDLTPHAQREYMEFIGVKTIDKINMIAPISVIEIDEYIIKNDTFDPTDPVNIGQPYEGGYLAGVIDSTQTEGASGERYALIVAPKASGEHSGLEWGGYEYTVNGADSTWNGKQNTIDLMADSQSHPAASFCDGLTIGGYSDWYLPASDELELLYRNFKPTAIYNYTSVRPLHNQSNGYNPNSYLTKNSYSKIKPSQTKLLDWQRNGSQFLKNNRRYFSSMEYSSNSAFVQFFHNGSQGYSNKYYTYGVRAVRRELI